MTRDGHVLEERARGRRAARSSPQDIQTEVFFFPSAQVAEMDGTFTNTQRLLQWHDKAADPPGDCRSDVWFTYQLGCASRRSTPTAPAPRDQGFKDLVWDYEHDDPHAARSAGRARRPQDPQGDQRLLHRRPGRHLATASPTLKDDGSTTCASWIYCGIFPAPDRNLAASQRARSAGQARRATSAGASPGRPIGASSTTAPPADRTASPWSERKKWVWWDGPAQVGRLRRRPTSPPTKPPNAAAKPDGIGLDAHSGTDPFIMKADGKGWLFVPTAWWTARCPPTTSRRSRRCRTRSTAQQANPVLKYWGGPGNPLAPVGDPAYPYVLTTYRLTEHHLSGAMSRWLPWLAELQPELFVEISARAGAARRGSPTSTGCACPRRARRSGPRRW